MWVRDFRGILENIFQPIGKLYMEKREDDACH